MPIRRSALTAVLSVFSLVICLIALAPAASALSTPQVNPNYEQSCMLDDSGNVKCAGKGTAGALGNGAFSNSTAFVPAQITEVTQLATGENHVCALRADGTVWCWGDNASYQLGQGGVGTADSNVPLQVQLNGAPGPLVDITQIATQDDTTCARRSDGKAFCWGAGSSGQIGDGGSTNLSLATAVFPLDGVSKVVAGRNFSCALLTNGSVKCWGSDSSGQIGNGAGAASPSPVDVLDLTNAVDIGLGRDNACALIADGTVKCWGSDANGVQGNGPGTTNAPAPVTVAGLAGVSQVAVGYGTACVVLADGSMQCWGDGSDGEMGDGLSNSKDVPTAIPGISGVVFLSKQFDESPCVGFRGGGVKCWGYNDNGNLGFPSADDVLAPTDVPNVDIVTQAYPGAGALAVNKPKLDKKKKTYTVSGTLKVTPHAFVAVGDACQGAVASSVGYKVARIVVVKRHGKKKRKKKIIKKTAKGAGLLTVSGADCASPFSLKLPVKYLNGKSVTVTSTAAGNASLTATTVQAKVKLQKVKPKRKKRK